MRVLDLGLTHYAATFAAMRRFTDARDDDTPDEIWLTEHHPVFTQGQAGRPEHVLAPGDIPVLQSDRGGQVTYHGPGQLVLYPMLDVRRLGLSPRGLVTALERAMIALLADHGVEGVARPEAPGVYVAGDKIGSLGLRIRRGRAYHGLALNVSMDLEPFSRINPCGLSNQRVTQLAEFVPGITVAAVKAPLVAHLVAALGG